MSMNDDASSKVLNIKFLPTNDEDSIKYDNMIKTYEWKILPNSNKYMLINIYSYTKSKSNISILYQFNYLAFVDVYVSTTSHYFLNGKINFLSNEE